MTAGRTCPPSPTGVGSGGVAGVGVGHGGGVAPGRK